MIEKQQYNWMMMLRKLWMMQRLHFLLTGAGGDSTGRCPVHLLVHEVDFRVPWPCVGFLPRMVLSLVYNIIEI